MPTKQRRPDWRTEGVCPKCKQDTVRLEGQFAAGKVKLGCGHAIVGWVWELQGSPPRTLKELAEAVIEAEDKGWLVKSKQPEFRAALGALIRKPDDSEPYGLTRPEWVAYIRRYWLRTDPLYPDKNEYCWRLKEEFWWRLRWEKEGQTGYVNDPLTSG